MTSLVYDTPKRKIHKLVAIQWLQCHLHDYSIIHCLQPRGFPQSNCHFPTQVTALKLFHHLLNTDPWFFQLPERHPCYTNVKTRYFIRTDLKEWSHHGEDTVGCSEGGAMLIAQMTVLPHFRKTFPLGLVTHFAFEAASILMHLTASWTYGISVTESE
jgi:hypothetical protein